MSLENSEKAFIKLFTKFLNWEWYTDVNTKVLFIHCLLKANWKDGNFRGAVCKRGQFITSLRNLAKETGLTVQEVRTAILHLKLTGEITDHQQGNFRIITVNKYDSYQTINNPNARLSTKYQQGINKASTTIEEDIEDIDSKRRKEEKNLSPEEKRERMIERQRREEAEEYERITGHPWKE